MTMQIMSATFLLEQRQRSHHMSNYHHNCGAHVQDTDSLDECNITLDDFAGEGNFWRYCETHDHAIEPVSVRTATITVKSVQSKDPLSRVQAFLPSNYRAVQVDAIIVITGYDSAGWTLDDYVLPRLASGNMFAKETN